MIRGWYGFEPIWFCEGLPESAWRRALVLWGAPAVPFFGFPRTVGEATISDRGAPAADEPEAECRDHRTIAESTYGNDSPNS